MTEQPPEPRHPEKTEKKGFQIDDPRLHQAPPEMPGYELEMHYQPSVTRLSIGSVIIFPFWIVLFAGWEIALSGGDFSIHMDLVSLLLVAFIVLIGVPVVHEAIHGAASLVFGARPFFGIGGGVAYTSFLAAVTPKQYLGILLSPIVIMTAMSLIGISTMPGFALPWIAFGAVNGAGAAGDLWMTIPVTRLGADRRIHDLADGFAVYRPAAQQS